MVWNGSVMIYSKNGRELMPDFTYLHRLVRTRYSWEVGPYLMGEDPLPVSEWANDPMNVINHEVESESESESGSDGI